MPRGGTWLYGFAGEYPWATPFNMNAKESHGSRGGDKDILDALTPSWSELAVKWEYDASLPGYFHMPMPVRDFFSHKDLWWDGRGGQLCNRNVVFRDPSVIENGPRALIADANDLLERLDRLGMHLIWTLLGEKWILGGEREDSRPICCRPRPMVISRNGRTGTYCTRQSWIELTDCERTRLSCATGGGFDGRPATE